MRVKISRLLAECLVLLALGAGCQDESQTASACGSNGRSHCVQQISLGTRFGCALLLDGTVWCWGRNDESQLGYATTDLCPEDLPGGMTQAVACHTFPFRVPNLDHVTHVASGGSSSCALRDDGAVRCWGGNITGQLGNGLSTPSAQPVAVRGLAGATAVATGARHACAVVGGAVWCWGANDRLQLGVATASRQCITADGMVPCESEPVQVAGLAGVTSIAAGAAHTCARTEDGAVVCWGDDRWGQLGDGNAGETPSATPRLVQTSAGPLFGATEVVAGASHTCVLRSDTSVWCWGKNDAGQLGSPPAAHVPEHCVGPCAPYAVLVPGLPYAPGAGDAGFGDAGTNDASTNDAGTGMDGSSITDGAPGDDVPGVEDVGAADVVIPPSMVPRAVAAGEAFTCALLDDGTLRCWGGDADGQLGDGRRTRDPQPPGPVIAQPGAARYNPLQGASTVAAGSATACALLADRTLRCWGSNLAGALGNGFTTSQSGPVPVTW